MEVSQMSGCFTMFSSCKNTPCYKTADVNNDGVVDGKDFKICVDKLIDTMHFDPVVAQDTFEKFCSKVEKAIYFLEAAQVLFASDPQTLEKIKLALTVLKGFTLLKAAVIDVGTQAREVTLNISNVGETITDVQRTSASIQAYLALFEKAGINVGIKADDFAQVDAALTKIKDMQVLWSALNQSTTPTAAAATPVLSSV